jgi:hypothetical protein
LSRVWWLTDGCCCGWQVAVSTGWVNALSEFVNLPSSQSLTVNAVGTSASPCLSGTVTISCEGPNRHASAVNLCKEVSASGVSRLELSAWWNDSLSLARIHFICRFCHGSLLTFSVAQFLIKFTQGVRIGIFNGCPNDSTSRSSADVRQPRHDRQLTIFWWFNPQEVRAKFWSDERTWRLEVSLGALEVRPSTVNWLIQCFDHIRLITRKRPSVTIKPALDLTGRVLTGLSTNGFGWILLCEFFIIKSREALITRYDILTADVSGLKFARTDCPRAVNRCTSGCACETSRTSAEENIADDRPGKSGWIFLCDFCLSASGLSCERHTSLCDCRCTELISRLINVLSGLNRCLCGCRCAEYRTTHAGQCALDRAFDWILTVVCCGCLSASQWVRWRCNCRAQVNSFNCLLSRLRGVSEAFFGCVDSSDLCIEAALSVWRSDSGCRLTSDDATRVVGCFTQ